MNATLTLTYLRPGEEFVLTGNPQTAEEYAAALRWDSDTTPPTFSEVVKAAADAEAHESAKAQAEADAVAAAIAHAKSLGFTDSMISVMYPGLVAPAT